MKVEEIIDKLESYILLQSLATSDDNKSWKIYTGETVHKNGLKVNDYIRLIEIDKDKNHLYLRKRYDKNVYLEILYTDKFVALNFFLKPQQKKVFNVLRQYYLQNKDVTRNATTDKFTAKFEDHNRFDEFFEKYIIGEDVCNLI